MTIEEVKRRAELYSALAEGKTIQDWTNSTWKDKEYTSFGELSQSPIKPEQKYRPFKTQEECWQEMLKHQPFGWIKDKNDGHYSMITTVDAAAGEGRKHIGISGGNIWTLSETMCDYTFADGTPFGINEDL